MLTCIAGGIVSVGYFTGYILHDLFLITLWIGWAITATIVGLMRGLASLFGYLTLGLTVLCEDFLWFLEDFGDAVDRAIACCVDAVADLGDILLSPLSAIVGFVVSAPSAARESIMSLKMGSHVVDGLVLVRDAVLLIGIVIWDGFALVVAALQFLNGAPHVVCVLVARWFDGVVADLASAVEAHSFKALCGLFLGYAMFHAARKTGLLTADLFKTLVTLSCRLISIGAVHLILLFRSSVDALRTTGAAAASFVARQFRRLTRFGRHVFREAVAHTPTKAALQIKLEKETAAMQCVICMDNRRNVMILNCRHLLMCRACAVTVTVNSGECPVCRSPIENIISVYT